MGEAYWLRYDMSSEGQWIDMALAHCDSAMALNNGLAQAYVVRGILEAGRNRYEEAADMFTRALTLDAFKSGSFLQLGGSLCRDEET